MHSNYSIFTRLTFAFFGIEESIWNKIEQQEQQKFNTLTFLVLLLSFIVFLGMYEFFILLLNEVFYAIGLGLVMTMIIMNIIRFSVFTIQNPIYHIPEVVLPSPATETTPVESTATPITPSVFKEISTKASLLLSRILSLFSFEMVVRIVINGILVLFVVLPFACILNSSYIDQINTVKRNELVANFKKSEEQNLEKKIEQLDLKINTLKSKIQSTQNSMYFAELSSELNTNAKLIADWEQNKNSAIANFEQAITHKNFIIYSYKSISNQFSFKFYLLVVGSLLLLCHLLKFSLVNKSTNSYYTLANKYYHALALTNYLETEEQIKQGLANKYTNKKFYNQLMENYEKWKANGRFINPPFNSIERAYKTPTKQLTPTEFINFYGAK